MNSRVVLISLSGENRELYTKLLNKHKNLELETYSTLLQFKRNCLNKKYSGFIVDIRTLIKSTSSDKDFYASLYKGFPILQIDKSHDDDLINCFIEGKKLADLKGLPILDYFINTVCANKIPRGVRARRRKTVFFNTILQFSPEDPQIKTNLWDICEGGCFVISNNEKPTGDLIWLKINELGDSIPICSKIKWKIPWGKSTKRLPGFGVSFLELTNQQRGAIEKITST